MTKAYIILLVFILVLILSIFSKNKLQKSNLQNKQQKETWTLFLFDINGNIRSTFLYNDLNSCWDGAVVGTDRGKTNFLCGRNCKDISIYGYQKCEKQCIKNTQDQYCLDLLFQN